MKLEWEGKVGPASILAVFQIIGLAVGGAIVWTQLSDKVSDTSTKVEHVQATASELRTALAASQTDRAAQSERLGRVEVAMTFLSDSIKRFSNKFDTGGNPSTPTAAPKP